MLKLAESVQDEDEYILKLSRYVHLDPVLIKKVKALPVRERVGILRAYPWKRILPQSVNMKRSRQKYKNYSSNCYFDVWYHVSPQTPNGDLHLKLRLALDTLRGLKRSVPTRRNGEPSS